MITFSELGLREELIEAVSKTPRANEKKQQIINVFFLEPLIYR